MQKYTVILLYPESVANKYGESYVSHTSSISSQWAIADAKTDMHNANDWQAGEFDDDIICLAVYDGHLESY